MRTEALRGEDQTPAFFSNIEYKTVSVLTFFEEVWNLAKSLRDGVRITRMTFAIAHCFQFEDCNFC